MKIAVAKNGTHVSAHFGHCEGFEVVEVKSDAVQVKTFLKNPGHQPGFLPQFLSETGIQVIIAGGMGAMAQNLFKDQGIEVVISEADTIENVIQQYLEGNLQSTDAVCDHHSHADSCGEH